VVPDAEHYACAAALAYSQSWLQVKRGVWEKVWHLFAFSLTFRGHGRPSWVREEVSTSSSSSTLQRLIEFISLYGMIRL
jgi:hypothetical protein